MPKRFTNYAMYFIDIYRKCTKMYDGPEQFARN